MLRKIAAAVINCSTDGEKTDLVTLKDLEVTWNACYHADRWAPPHRLSQP